MSVAPVSKLFQGARRKRRVLLMRKAPLSSALLAAAISICLLATTPTKAENPTRAALPNLSSRLSSIHFYVYDGRLQAVANEPSVERDTSSDLGGTNRREKLIVSTNADQDASIEYDLLTGDEILTANVVDGRQFTISRRSKSADGVAIEFNQPQDGPITLAVKENGNAREAKGATIWHLLIAEPELCGRCLIPLLEMFRPDWHLTETARSIAAQMLRTAGEFREDNLRAWDSLVADLASDRFAERQRAERELRAAGATVIPYLQGLDRRRLDFEQRSRIQHIIDSADNDDEDRAEGVASRLMADRQVWLVLLDRPDETTRRTAARALSYLSGEPVSFDPAAPAPVRQRQLDSLRKRIAAETPVAAK
jgi:hypothetical protein